MIGALLCRLGWHRWDYRTTFFGGWQFDGCSRCSAIKEPSEPYDKANEERVRERMAEIRAALSVPTRMSLRLEEE